MWEIRQVGDEWEIIDADEQRVGDTHGTYELAVSFLAGMLTIARAQLAVDDAENEGAPEGDGLLPERWVADPALCLSQPTGDGRDFSGCEWTSRDPNVSLLPLMLQTSTEYGHFGAQLAGFIEELTDLGTGTNPGGSGRFYDSEAGVQFRDMLLDGRRFGVSVDPGRVEVDWECTAEDEDGYCVAETAMFRAYEIIGVTGTPFPGFAEAAIRLDTSEAMAAAAPPARPAPARRPVDLRVAGGVDLLHPPAEWFRTEEPQLGEPFALGSLGDEWLVDQGDGRIAMPLHITDDGRLAGHLAVDGQNHVGYPGANVTPPTSASAYAHFHVGEVVTAEGERIATGALTAGCDHAVSNLRAPEARDHYAHNGIAWGNARVSPGEHGPWVCGAIRHDVTDEQLAILRAGTLSGDWRKLGAGLDLISVLAVSTPGFPVAREAVTASGLGHMPTAPLPQASMVDGEQVSLIASAIVRRCPDCARRAQQQASARSRVSAGVEEGMLRGIASQLAIIERRTRHLVDDAAQHAAARIRR